MKLTSLCDTTNTSRTKGEWYIDVEKRNFKVWKCIAGNLTSLR